MPQNSYQHPPITEAVIQITFASPHNKSKLEKFIKKLKRTYADYQELISYKLDIDISNVRQEEAITNKIPELVHRLTSEDMTQQLLLNETSIVVSQLAPYCGWNNFIDRFSRDWKVWKQILGFNEIKQIGVRYINRLDVEITGPTIEFSDYVNLYPKFPESLGAHSYYAIQSKIPINELKSMLSLNSAVVASPLLGHVSLVIDQDIVRVVDLPQNDESILSFLNEIHTKKNSIFESCVTDKARELFNK